MCDQQTGRRVWSDYWRTSPKRTTVPQWLLNYFENNIYRVCTELDTFVRDMTHGTYRITMDYELCMLAEQYFDQCQEINGISVISPNRGTDICHNPSPPPSSSSLTSTTSISCTPEEDGHQMLSGELHLTQFYQEMHATYAAQVQHIAALREYNARQSSREPSRIVQRSTRLEKADELTDAPLSAERLIRQPDRRIVTLNYPLVHGRVKRAPGATPDDATAHTMTEHDAYLSYLGIIHPTTLSMDTTHMSNNTQ